MSYRIKCLTLFDITKTGVLSRHRPPDDADIEAWRFQRNTQNNFDTILQAISLRSQPEQISSPQKIDIDLNNTDYFGFLHSLNNDNTTVHAWSFTFEIHHPSVFYDGINELGALYSDCNGVPMLICGTEAIKLPGFLDTSPELRNIYFKINDA